MEKLQFKKNTVLTHYLQFSFLTDEDGLPRTTCSLFWNLFFSIFLLPIHIFFLPLNIWAYLLKTEDNERILGSVVPSLAFLIVFTCLAAKSIDEKLNWTFMQIYWYAFLYLIAFCIGLLLAVLLIVGILQLSSYVYSLFPKKKPKEEKKPSPIREAIKLFKEKHCKPISWI